MEKYIRIGKLCLAAAVAILLMISSCLCAWAAVPDLQYKCSVTFTMSYNGVPLEGGNLKMYRIASWTPQGNTYVFAWVPELADAGLDLNDYASETFARRIFMLVESRSLPARIGSVGADGMVSFTGLDSGLYVVYQTEAAKGYEPINAFCMSLPMEINGEFVYSVQASPKPRPVIPPESTTDVTNPGFTTPDVTTPDVTTPDVTTPDTSDPFLTTTTTQYVPTTQQQDTLPQTGQLWWPSWLIGAVGLILCGLGLVIRVVYREGAEESES